MSLSINHTVVRSTCTPKPLSLLGRMRNFMALTKQRRDLEMLDAHILADIGVTRAQAEKEAAKPAWDVPHYWHH